MTQWYCSKHSRQKGPITLDQLKSMIEKGELSGTSLVWEEGTKDWLEVRQHPELIPFVSTQSWPRLIGQYFHGDKWCFAV